jgi:hypothetical protein
MQEIGNGTSDRSKNSIQAINLREFKKGRGK